ncbi:uncharacterized protein PAC_14042 [Phialocephala subalpina]|uniref:Cellobiose dehydrogenase cytochrome domain-containing protein n=1 Tax=Phialocephala subalpina TaxID=576137 RepID=A0A1L7XGH6_9HELO|nr:uncharacterized protein PAC_14042 [Phialocephala subalpina]
MLPTTPTIRTSISSHKVTWVLELQVEVLTDTTTDGKMAVGAPWMYASGPSGNPVTSNSSTAGLAQHTAYGKFTMDMVQSTGTGALPNAVKQMSGVTVVGKSNRLYSTPHTTPARGSTIPVDPIYTLHRLVSWFGLRVWDSTYYNRPKNWGTPLQIFGYIAIVFLLILVPFRIISHHSTRSETEQKRLTIAGKALGHLTWILALVNGFLGIKLADSKARIYIAYGCCIIAIFLVTIPSMIMIKRRQRRRDHVKITNQAGAVPET